MTIVFPFSLKDETLALKLARWILELGGAKGHDCLMVYDARCNPVAIADVLGQAFDKVIPIRITEDVYDKWPESCNLMFRRAAKFIEYETQAQHWLWLEADAVPIREGWLDTLEAEYRKGQRPFMGDFVNVEGVEPHMSGIGIYPHYMTRHAGLAVIQMEIAWDVAAAGQIVPNMFKTRLIEHAWKHPQFKDWTQVEREIRPETVLYHSSKDGSLIDLLQQRRGKGRKVVTGEPTTFGVSVAPCDIFIKTFPPDYEWLHYCLRSIDKFASGFRQVVIAVPEANLPSGSIPLRKHPFHVEVVGEQPDGYLWQQVVKLDADKYSDAASILHIDSDTIFTRPVTPQTYAPQGKIEWMMTPFAKTETPWQPIIEKFLKRPVTFEFMRRAPQMIPRWLYAALRAFCEREHGTSMESYIMNQPFRAFSEFNALGAFAHEFCWSSFNWINTDEIPPQFWPVLTVDQRWSRGGLTPEIKVEWEKILSGGVESRHAELVEPCTTDAHSSNPAVGGDTDSQAIRTSVSQPASGSSAPPAQNNLGEPDNRLVNSQPSPPTVPQIDGGEVASSVSVPHVGGSETPLSNGADSVASLARDTVAILKGLCRNPHHTNLVRRELRAQGVIR